MQHSPRRQVLIAVAIIVVGSLVVWRSSAASLHPSAGTAGPAGASSWQGGASETTGVTSAGGGVGVVRRPSGPLLVDVAGAVRRPGVYELDAGARVLDAVRAAGGARSGADLDAINRAALVVDGQQIRVPESTPAGTPAGSTGVVSGAATGMSGSTPDGPVSINVADLSQLDTLPGIGPATAQRIIDDRAAHGPFGSVSELDRVPGVGPGTIAQLEGLVTT